MTHHFDVRLYTLAFFIRRDCKNVVREVQKEEEVVKVAVYL